MQKHLLIALTASMLFGVSQVHAAPIVFTADLAPEIGGTSGTGFVTVMLDPVAHTLQVDATFSNLTGVTTVAHIHCCVDPPGIVGVATYPTTFPGFPAGVTNGSYSSPLIDLTDSASFTAGFRNNFGGGTNAGAEAALLTGLLTGRAYFNIHTSFSSSGEIRGFLAPVPEPGVLTLLAVGLCATLSRGRRIRHRPIAGRA
jgi:hypothetical protein